MAKIKSLLELEPIKKFDEWLDSWVQAHDERIRKEERAKITGEINVKLGYMAVAAEYISTEKPDTYDGWLAAIKEIRTLEIFAQLEKEQS